MPDYSPSQTLDRFLDRIKLQNELDIDKLHAMCIIDNNIKFPPILDLHNPDLVIRYIENLHPEYFI